jgi:hypothetical protein
MQALIQPQPTGWFDAVRHCSVSPTGEREWSRLDPHHTPNKVTAKAVPVRGAKAVASGASIDRSCLKPELDVPMPQWANADKFAMWRSTLMSGCGANGDAIGRKDLRRVVPDGFDRPDALWNRKARPMNRELRTKSVLLAPRGNADNRADTM